MLGAIKQKQQVRADRSTFADIRDIIIMKDQHRYGQSAKPLSAWEYRHIHCDSLQSWHNRCQSILMKSLLYGLDIAQQLNNNKKKKSMFKENFWPRAH